MSDDQIQWNERGLAPAVVQDARTGAVLMLAWMNLEALERTRSTGYAHFYSRSREQLWKKGETSGNTLSVTEVRVDCDADAILVAAIPAGPTCHTGATSCFYAPLDGDRDADPPGTVLDRLERILRQRRDSASADQSYTRSLLDGGFSKMLAKIAEEHGELAEVLPDGDESAVVHEAADLLFHVMVGLVARDISMVRVLGELARRLGVSGHVEKASR